MWEWEITYLLSLSAFCSASRGTDTKLRWSAAGIKDQTEDEGRNKGEEGRNKGRKESKVICSQEEGLPSFPFLLLRYESCRSVCSESWCHVKLTALCVNMTLLYIPVLHPPSPPKPTSFPLYLHMILPASLVLGQSVQGAAIKGEEGAKVFPHSTNSLTE